MQFFCQNEIVLAWVFKGDVTCVIPDSNSTKEIFDNSVELRTKPVFEHTADQFEKSSVVEKHPLEWGFSFRCAQI